jgi:hypothetical protein
MPVCVPGGVNEEQECTVVCNDDGTYTFTVAAGVFIAASQAEANAIASSYACNQAYATKLCMANITSEVLCAGDELDETVAVLGEERNLVFEIISGALPSGIELIGQNMAFQLFGIPDTAGQYAFTVRATDDDGNYADKAYRMVILEITDSSLPGFQIGIPYAYTFTGNGGDGNYLWSLVSGTLPSGLTLSPGGTISGTPNVAAVDSTFVIKMVDLDFQAATDAGCQRTFGIFETGGRITEEEESRLTEESEYRITEDQ